MPLLRGLVLAVAFVVAGAVVRAADHTLVGTLIDQICYLKDPATANPDHDQCAQICAKRASPLAVLTDDGRLYVVAGDLIKESNWRMRPYIGRRVQVTGRILEQRAGRVYDVDTGRPVAGRILHDQNGLIIEAPTIAPAPPR